MPTLTAGPGGHGRRALRAFALTFLASTTGRAFTVLATLILARLLSPSDFGIASLGLLVVFVLMPITDIGFAQAIVRTEQQEVSQRARTAFWLVVLLSLVLYALCYALAEPIAILYGRQEIAPMLRVIALAVPTYAASRIPSALLDRGLHLGRQGLPDVAASVAYAVIAVSLAYLHFGFWSIAIAAVARSAVLSGGVFLATRWRPSWTFDASIAGDLLTYARYLLAGAMLRLAYTNIDNAIVGKVLGMSALGSYALAFNLGTLFSSHISPPLGKVLFPTYSRLLLDPPRAQHLALLVLRYTCLFISPITAIGIVAAPSFVPLVLGAKWSSLVPALQMLLIYGWAVSVAPVFWASMLAAGLNLISLVLALSAVYPIAVRYGFTGVAAWFTVVEVVRLGMLATLTRRSLKFSWLALLRVLWPGVAGSALAALVFVLLRQVWPSTTLVSLAITIGIAAAAYAAAVLAMGVLRPSQLATLREALRPT
jgi:PST family polysaccharide transporter